MRQNDKKIEFAEPRVTDHLLIYQIAVLEEQNWSFRIYFLMTLICMQLVQVQ